MGQKLRDLTRDMWNVPNALTFLRLILVPVFAVLELNGHMWAALVVFAVASVTDWADGYIARKYSLITNFGKLVDPLADKLMVVTALVCHGVIGVFPWLPVILVAVKELLMILGGLLMLTRNIVVYSNMWGKVATVVFMAALIAGFFHSQLAAWGFQADVWLLWLAVALAYAALAAYGVGALRTLRDQREKK